MAIGNGKKATKKNRKTKRDREIGTGAYGVGMYHVHARQVVDENSNRLKCLNGQCVFPHTPKAKNGPNVALHHVCKKR